MARRVLEKFALVEGAGVLAWRDVPVVPEKKITGRTGRMHGEMPVIKPPRKPMSTRVNMTGVLSFLREQTQKPLKLRRFGCFCVCSRWKVT